MGREPRLLPVDEPPEEPARDSAPGRSRCALDEGGQGIIGEALSDSALATGGCQATVVISGTHIGPPVWASWDGPLSGPSLAAMAGRGALSPVVPDMCGPNPEVRVSVYEALGLKMQNQYPQAKTPAEALADLASLRHPAALPGARRPLPLRMRALSLRVRSEGPRAASLQAIPRDEPFLMG
jgi:hypothetical protein